MAKSKEEAPTEAQMTKAAAVREAIKAGMDKPANAVAYIKEKFDLDVTAQQFSIYKSADKKKKKKGGAVSDGRRKNPKKGGIVDNGKHPKGGSVNNGVRLARDVKKLVDEYGARAVKEMADVFAE